MTMEFDSTFSAFPYDVQVDTAAGTQTTLARYSDKVLLVVNVASKCGLTPQYAQLEQLQRSYGDRGLQVLGFPCDQFGGQEPGTSEEIAAFCSATYGITFPVLSKIEVNGPDRHPLYSALTVVEDAVGEAGDIEWNFEKFLVAPGGSLIRRFRPRTQPDDAVIVDALEGLLPS